MAPDALTDEDLTPTVRDPCQWCGRQVVRVSDHPYDVPPPESLSHAVAGWKDCVATQRTRWAFCPRAVKGFISVPIEGSEAAQVPLERRASLR